MRDVRPKRMRSPLVAAVALAMALGCTTPRAQSAATNPDAREWVPLFDGRTLNGWIPKFAKHEVGENYANTFRVVDGTIQARYDGYGGNYDAQFGHLYYECPFSYYLLSMEYRLVGELYPGSPSYTIRNSGVMVHSQDPRTMPRDQNFPISLEMQFLGGLGDGRPRPTGNLCTPGTDVEIAGQRDRRHCINSSSRTYDGDGWVRAEVLVLGDSVIKHIIDGDTVLTYGRPRIASGVVTGFDPAQLRDGAALSSGYVALQAEGHPIDFRDVRLLPLEGCTDPRAANYKRYLVRSVATACRYAGGRP